MIYMIIITGLLHKKERIEEEVNKENQEVR